MPCLLLLLLLLALLLLLLFRDDFISLVDLESLIVLEPLEADEEVDGGLVLLILVLLDELGFESLDFSFL